VTADLDRKALQHILKLGGQIWLDDAFEPIKADAILLGGPLKVRQLELVTQQLGGGVPLPVSEADVLNIFRDLPAISDTVVLRGHPVTDAGLATLVQTRALAGVAKFTFQSSELTDAGLRHFVQCKNVAQLTEVANAYSAHSDAQRRSARFARQIQDAGEPASHRDEGNGRGAEEVQNRMGGGRNRAAGDDAVSPGAGKRRQIGDLQANAPRSKFPSATKGRCEPTPGLTAGRSRIT
jgi:hypothetical protein